MTNKLPSIFELHLMFELRDGRLYWGLSPATNVPVGTEAGGFDADGYRVVRIKGRRFKTHRIVFAMTHGFWPAGDVDHKNTSPADNEPGNLREASDSQNRWNQRRAKNNTSGHKGVSFCKRTGKWKAQIQAHKEKKHLGLFCNKEEAISAYTAAAAELHGEFANIGATP